MTVYVLVRENQNCHGFIDVSIEAIYSERRNAEEEIELSSAVARREGLRVEGDHPHGWDVSWRIEEHPLE